MPRGQPIGEEVYRPEVTPESEPRKVIPEERQAPLVGGVEAVAGALGQKYAADSATYAGDQLANLRVNTLKALQDAKAAVPAGDPGNFAENFMAQYDSQAKATVGKAADNPIASSMLDRGASQLRASVFEHALEWEAHQRVAYQTDSLQKNLERQLPLVRQHPETADQIGQSLVEQANLSRLEPAEKLAYMNRMHSALTRSAALGMVDQNPHAVYEQLLGESDQADPHLQELDPVSRAEVLDSARRGVVTDYAANAIAQYRAGGPEAGSRALEELNDLKLPGPQGEQDVMREAIRSEVEKQRAGLIAEQKQKFADRIIDVEEQLRSKDPDPRTRGEIWSLYHNNALDPHSTGAALGALDAAERGRTEAEAGISAIQDAWDGKTLLDPKSKQVKDDLYEWFEAFTKANDAPTGSQSWVNLGAEFARRTGVIPDNVGEWARQVLVGSQDPKQIIAASDAVERMRAAAPRGFPYFDDDKKLGAMADQVARLTKNGVPAVEAVKMARELASQGDEDRQRLDEMWKQQAPFASGQRAIEGVIRQQLADDPRLTSPGLLYGRNLPGTIPPEMEADYSRLVRGFFQYNGGNLQQAEDSANERIGKAWGITNVNGQPELMRYPPERVFPGLTVEDIRGDITQQVKEHAEAFQRWSDADHKLETFHVEPDKVHLVPIPGLTDTTGGREWGLMYESEQEFGAPEVIFRADGRPLTYTLPVGKEDYEATRKRQYDAQVKKAQAEYERITAADKAAYDALKLDAQYPNMSLR
ncbi:MAG TPA: hypothetical protein VMU47_06805 [Caldimonas sp.]|nr:hypothetical protein [Caldimonas sp.]